MPIRSRWTRKPFVCAVTLPRWSGFWRPVGLLDAKLDFLIQEINREINTIGSKANDIQTAKLVVDLKAELEKMREQVQNIE